MVLAEACYCEGEEAEGHRSCADVTEAGAEHAASPVDASHKARSAGADKREQVEVPPWVEGSGVTAVALRLAAAALAEQLSEEAPRARRPQLEEVLRLPVVPAGVVAA